MSFVKGLHVEVGDQDASEHGSKQEPDEMVEDRDLVLREGSEGREVHPSVHYDVHERAFHEEIF